MAQAGPPGMGASPMGPPTVTPPTGPSPIKPPVQEGLKAQARVKMQLASQALIEALGILKDVSSEEAKAILSALKGLGSVIPDAAEGLSQSALSSMTGAAPAVKPNMLGVPTPRPATVAGPRARSMPMAMG